MKHKALSIAILSLHCGLMANPTNPQVSNGDVSFDASTPGVLNIQADDRSIINWQDFSIQAGEITQFIQPDSSSAVLNRVMGGNASSIMGSLQANGKVYLINPNGVIFGKDSVVNTGALIASALDLPDQLFLQDGDLLFSGDSNAALVNFGAIQASNGDVILIGYQVENNGTIDAPNGVAAMAAGREVLIRPLAQERIYIRLRTAEEDMSGVGIDNAGDISALQAELKADGNSFAKAIHHTGSIEATGIVDQGGRVYLVSSNGNMEISGFIAAQDGQGNGGEVDLLAQNIAMSPDGVVNVDGGSSGNGGTVLFFADNAAIFYGTISAEGGEMGGDGGFVEVSGPSLDFSGKVSTYAPVGKTGSLLLDPYYITISDASTTTGTGFSVNGVIYNGLQVSTHPQPPPFGYTSTSNLNINGMGGLVEQLNKNQVVIRTNEDIAGEPPVPPNPNPSAGNVDILGDIIWHSDNALLIYASNDINVRKNIKNDGLISGIFLEATRDVNIGNPNPTMADPALTDPIQVSCLGSPSTLPLLSSFVALKAGRNVNIAPGAAYGAFAQVGSDAPIVNCNLTISAGGALNLLPGPSSNPFCYAAIGHGGLSGLATSLNGLMTGTVGAVNLQGGQGPGCHAIIGHYAQTNGAKVDITGDIVINTRGVQEFIHLSAGIGTNSFALIGHGSNGVAAGSTFAGNISLDSYGDIILQGGNAPTGQGTGAFAAIGFTDGGVIDAGNITVNAPDFLRVDAGKEIKLITGNQINNNASIGALFNNNDPNMTNSIMIKLITVNSYTSDLSLIGSAGSPLAYAIIGATSDPKDTGAVANQVVSNVVIYSGGNFLLTSVDGTARVLNGDNFVIQPDTFVDLNVGENATITAGNGAATLFSTGILLFTADKDISLKSSPSVSASISSFGDLTCIADGNLSLNGGTTGLQEASIVSNFGNASVQAFNITMNPNSLIGTELAMGLGTVTVNATDGDLTIKGDSLNGARVLNNGGKDTTLDAKGNINIQKTFLNPIGLGTFTLKAGKDLIIGDDSNILSTEVSQYQGKIAVSVDRDLQVIGGSTSGAHSILGPFTGGNLEVQFNITKVGGRVLVLGGNGGDSFAQIGTNNQGNVIGNITFSDVAGDVILNAGMGDTSFAQIGSQGDNVNTTVTFSSVGGNVTLIPRVGFSNAFAQIGSRYTNGSPGVPTLTTVVGISPCYNPCPVPSLCTDPYAVIDNVLGCPVVP